MIRIFYFDFDFMISVLRTLLLLSNLIIVRQPHFKPNINISFSFLFFIMVIKNALFCVCVPAMRLLSGLNT